MKKHLSDEELACWVAFDQVPCKGLGTRKLQDIHEYFQSMHSAWQASRNELQKVQNLPWNLISAFAESRSAVNPEALLQTCRNLGVTVCPIGDPDYPDCLKHIHDPPAVLYIKGTLFPDDFVRAVAIVGTRRPTAYGQKMAKEIGRVLSQNGVTVISGMAVGIDSFAHRAALEAGGRTIAVLGCGPDVCYPSSNRPLHRLLTEEGRGAVISEYFPGTKPDTWRFPARNRIVAGLSCGVVVVEAGMTSGALITADMAFNEGRPLFAVPGRVDMPMSEGCHKLISDEKANIFRSTEELLRKCNWSGEVLSDEPENVELYGKERDLYELLTNEPSHFDALCERSGMHAGELSATLTMLELAGVITRHPGDWYSRN